MTDKIIIVGLGETAELAYEYFTYDSPYEVVGFSADDQYCDALTFCNKPVIKLSELHNQFPCSDYKVFVAVSSTKLNRVREALYKKIKLMGYSCVSYVSSKTFIWHNVEMGENCFILEDNTLQPFTKIGNNVVMWSGNHLGHRSIIKDHCFITSQVVISGFCEIGEFSFVGVNATLADSSKVAEDNFIAMSASISGDTEPNSIYSGIPGKRRERLTAKMYCKV
jgi:sugar O-acyltransferase (sialic acid O-acetyltransferase NeuD family)